ncbi:hypothetical protein J6590_008404 [Homalodisca vitripennis]|nr:hypothetical protein J6590_008404 [Homalodisca vitripennis]
MCLQVVSLLACLPSSRTIRTLGTAKTDRCHLNLGNLMDVSSSTSLNANVKLSASMYRLIDLRVYTISTTTISKFKIENLDQQRVTSRK